MMKDLAEKMFLGVRNLPQYPFGKALDAAASEAKEVADANQADLDPLNKLIKSSETLAPPIRIDEEDNVPVDPETKSVPHVGPIDAKIIRGTDGRNYLLEMMRLTPRDANYVSAEKSTTKISADDLQKVDASLTSTYILRQELIGIFLQRKVNLERSNLLTEAQGRQQEEREKLAAKAKDEAAKSQVTVEDGEESEVKIVKEDASAEEQAAAKLASLDAELENTLTAEYAEKYRAINVQSIGLEINPNVFLPFTAETNPEQLAKDEDTAREIAALLWDFVLPAFIRQVREGDVTPRDSTSLIQSMHRLGINVRYLGRLAYLAVDQEREDTELFLQGKQRIHAMPQYFTELLLVEMIARAVKHVVNRHFRDNKLFAAAPAQSLASLLNNILGALQETDDSAANAANGKDGEGKKKNKKNKQPTNNNTSNTVSEATHSHPVTTTSKSGKKNKKHGSHKHSADLSLDQSLFAADSVEAAVDVFADKEQLFKELHSTITSRYLFDMSIFNQEAEEDVILNEEDAMAALANLSKKLLAKSSLRRRVNPIVLLRRVCQQLGLVIAAKDYAFANSNAPIVAPQDILTLLPRVKTCEPDTYLPDFQDYLASSAAFLQQGNAMAAFEAAQEALNMITQVTGTAHEQAFQAMDQLTAVFVATADVNAATHMSARTLALSAQVQGLDCQETIQHHIQLAMLESEMDNIPSAFRHLLAAKYIVQLVAGDRHPELGNIFFRLSTLYEKVGNFDAAMLCIHSARRLTSDLSRNAMLAQAEAALAFRHHRVTEAVSLQKHGYRLVKDIFGVEDDRVLMAKKNLETYIRAASDASVIAAAAAQEEIGEEDDGKDQGSHHNSDRKNKNKKNKNKGKK
jgi:protein TIF31